MKTRLIGLSLLLVILGAINWGSIGFFGIDLVSTIFGFSPLFVKILYVLVGVAGIHIALVMKDILSYFGGRFIR